MNSVPARARLVAVLLVCSGVTTWSCSPIAPAEEAVDIDTLLPAGAVTEISSAYPEFGVSLVDPDAANVAASFEGRGLHIHGIEDGLAREKIAKYVLKYLQNPNKKAEDAAKRAAFESLPPEERMRGLVEKIRKKHPDFDYKWVGLTEGNTQVRYYDNGLIITGIPEDGAREEIAYAVAKIQKAIDKAHSESGGREQ